MRENRPIIRRLLCIIFLDQTYLTIAFPLLALIFFDADSRLFNSQVSYTERSVWYGLCIALPNLINLVFAPLLSGLSDSVGRKKILMVEIGSAIFFTGFVGLGVYLGKLWLVLCGFVIKGAFSRANPTALAIIGDTVSKQDKIVYMGYLQFAISVGASIGPFLGGFFASRYFFPTLNFSLPFFIGTVFAVINFFLLCCLMPETAKKTAVLNQPREKFNLQSFREVFFQPEVLRISFILMLIQMSWSTYYQFMPPILKINYQYLPSQLGAFIAMIAFWLAITTGVAIKALHGYLKPKQMLILAASLVSFGLLFTLSACLLHLPQIWLWCGAFPVAAGDVIAYTCLTAAYSNSMPMEKQGKVMGMSFIVVASSWAFTGFTGGYLLSLHSLLPLLIAPIFAIAALTLLTANFSRKLVPTMP